MTHPKFWKRGKKDSNIQKVDDVEDGARLDFYESEAVMVLVKYLKNGGVNFNGDYLKEHITPEDTLRLEKALAADGKLDKNDLDKNFHRETAYGLAELIEENREYLKGVTAIFGKEFECLLQSDIKSSILPTPNYIDEDVEMYKNYKTSSKKQEIER